MSWVAIRFAYDGTAFPAYAIDPGQPGSVEAHLQRALRDQGMSPGSFRTGSRTDAGVSALTNVCRARLDRPHLEGLLPALQRMCPAGLWITGVASVSEAWNPRHAQRREYLYHAWPTGDLPKARDACRRFLGTHHMGAFARLEPGRDPVRRIDLFDVAEVDGYWRFQVTGPSFLWHQVRRMVGAVLAVAQERAEPEAIDEALSSGVAPKTFGRAPAEGLVLAAVDYPELEWTTGTPVGGALRRQATEAHVRAAVAKHVLGP